MDFTQDIIRIMDFADGMEQITVDQEKDFLIQI